MLKPATDSWTMSISAVSGSSASEATPDVQRQVAVMKKARDVEKATAEALLELVKQGTPGPRGGRIDVYA